mgnify:FL=1
MKVTVPIWEGDELQGVSRLQINDNCPVCGAKRGKLHSVRVHRPGASFWVEQWVNPCGHRDKLEDVLAEGIPCK